MIALQDLELGARIKIKGDIVGEVIENPKDGMWVLVRWISAPGDPDAAGKEELVHADQVLDLA